MKKEELYRVKYFLIFLGMVFSLFAYVSWRGYKVFGTNSEKWSPTEQGIYHK